MDAAHELAGHCNLCGRGLPKLAKFCPRCGGTVHEDLNDGRRRVIERRAELFSVRHEVTAATRPPPLPGQYNSSNGCLVIVFTIMACLILFVVVASIAG